MRCLCNVHSMNYGFYGSFFLFCLSLILWLETSLLLDALKTLSFASFCAFYMFMCKIFQVVCVHERSSSIAFVHLIHSSLDIVVLKNERKKTSVSIFKIKTHNFHLKQLKIKCSGYDYVQTINHCSLITQAISTFIISVFI